MTPLRYSKKNSVFGYYLGTNIKPNRGLQLDSSNIRIETLKFVFYNSCCIRVWTMVFEQFRTGLVFVLRLNTIFGFKYRASTRPRLQAFKIRLENESRVGTPICRSLMICNKGLWYRVHFLKIVYFPEKSGKSLISKIWDYLLNRWGLCVWKSSVRESVK